MFPGCRRTRRRCGWSSTWRSAALAWWCWGFSSAVAEPGSSKTMSQVVSNSGKRFVFYLWFLFWKILITVKVNQIEQHWIAWWRHYYNDQIHDFHSLRKTSKILGYYSIFSDQTSWINYGCVSLGRNIYYIIIYHRYAYIRIEILYLGQIHK